MKKNSLLFSIFLNTLITLIFILVLFLAAKSSRNSAIYQEATTRSQFLSRIVFKASVTLTQSKFHLLKTLKTQDINELYKSEEQFLASLSNYKFLLSEQKLKSLKNSSQFLSTYDELKTNYAILLVDEKKAVKNVNLIEDMLSDLELLSQDLLGEESVIWVTETDQLGNYIDDKNNDKIIFIGLSISFMITQFLVLYFIITKNRLIKKIKLQNEQIVQQTRLSTLGLLSAELAHEINSPLMVIDGRLKIIESTISNNPNINEKVQSNLEIIKRNSVRIHSIIKSFKTMATDGSNDEFESILISKIFEEVKEITSARCLKKQVKLVFNSPISMPHIFCNKVQITQVLTNLVSNSIDAIKDLDSKWITLDIHENPLLEETQIIITDSGQGIPDHIAQKMFQSFYTTKTSNEGTGLGLSISKKIMYEHHGNLTYNPDASNTQFILTFKMKKA